MTAHYGKAVTVFPCCDRAWAKVRGTTLAPHPRANVIHETGAGETCEESVPGPATPEWLFEVFEAAEQFAVLRVSDGWLATLMIAGEDYGGLGPDRYRALCTAVNASPCERSGK